MITTPTPAVIARKISLQRQENERLWMAMRRREAARNGYRGPLTRAELAAQASERADREQIRAILPMF